MKILTTCNTKFNNELNPNGICFKHARKHGVESKLMSSYSFNKIICK